VAFSLEKGRTYLVVKTTFAYRSDVHSNAEMRIVSKRYHALFGSNELHLQLACHIAYLSLFERAQGELAFSGIVACVPPVCHY
jgi:hypothetical protein